MSDTDATPSPDGERLTLVDHRTERGTRVFDGKPYHWAHNERGNLVLLPGPDPRRIADVVGVKP
jgi:hypothetical protein